VARLLGDRTAEQEGRLTLNPIRHLDPFGTLMIVITTFTGVAGIGWGKPVPVNGAALRNGRAGMALVSAAGPISNVLLAIVSGLLLTQARELIGANEWSAGLVELLLRVNIGLAAFNLLPIAPLDGFGVLIGVVPAPVAYRLAWLGQYGPGILLILVFSGSILGFSLLSFVLSPFVRAVSAIVLGVVNLFR
jgi:Zn-dependent protease